MQELSVDILVTRMRSELDIPMTRFNAGKFHQFMTEEVYEEEDVPDYEVVSLQELHDCYQLYCHYLVDMLNWYCETYPTKAQKFQEAYC